MDAKKIKEELIRQKNSNFKGNLYHFSKVSFAYKSNAFSTSELL